MWGSILLPSVCTHSQAHVCTGVCVYSTWTHMEITDLVYKRRNYFRQHSRSIKIPCSLSCFFLDTQSVVHSFIHSTISTGSNGSKARGALCRTQQQPDKQKMCSWGRGDLRAIPTKCNGRCEWILIWKISQTCSRQWGMWMQVAIEDTEDYC